MAQQSPDPGDPGGGGGYVPPPPSGQGWTIDAVGDTITFFIAPANGAAIVVKEYAPGALTGTSNFALGAWCAEYGYPSEVEFFSDRLWFAGTVTDPQTVWGTQVGDYGNFGKTVPLVDSDAITITINARQVNAITDLIALDKFLIMTKGGEWIMTEDQKGNISPGVGLKPQSYRGTGGVQCSIVSDTAIMVQEQGSRVFDIGYRFESDGYKPQDISVFAEHLVQGYTLTTMAWAPAPFSLVWFVRDDGTALGCTYMPEQEVLGWHRHDTDGEIEDIVTLPGTTETQIYAIVKRTIDGQTRRYVEKLAPSYVDDVRDHFYVDSGLTYDGRNSTATTLALTGGTEWTEDEDLTLTASSALFVGASDINDGFLVSSGDESVRLRIVGYTSSTVVTVNSVGTVPATFRTGSFADWVFLRDTVSGLDHLEGETVAILADADVHPQKEVVGGTVLLDYPAGVVHVGLPYRAMIETLEINDPGQPTLRNTKKLMHRIGLIVRNTRGIQVGSHLDHLDELPQREFEAWGENTSPLTGFGRVDITAQWGVDAGKLYIVSDDPLPAEILAIVPTFMASEN